MIISKLNIQETGNLSNLLYTGKYLSLGFFFGTFAIVVGRQILELDEFKYLKLSHQLCFGEFKTEQNRL